jgi:mono/diheme cytochrome c family protein
MNHAAVAAALSLIAQVAAADESAVQLKPGSGSNVVQTSCIGCHSLDYIEMNSAFLDAKGWMAEVTKMIKAFSAPIE